MKIARVIIFVLAMSIAAHVAVAQDARAQARHQLALRSAATEAAEMLQSLAQANADADAQLSSRLTELMLADVAGYREADASRRRARVTAEELKTNMISDALADIAARAQSHSPQEVAIEDLIGALSPDWNAQRDAAVSSYLERGYQQIFADARSAAVARQRDELEGKITYPYFDTLDRLLIDIRAARGRPEEPLRGDDFSPLLDSLATVMLDDFVVFAELDGTVRELNSSVVDHIASEYGRQLEIVDQSTAHLAVSDITAARISAAIGESLSKGVSPRQGPPPTYDVFAVIHDYADHAASALESALFAEFLAETDGISVDPDEVEQLIVTDLASHHAYDQSASRLAQHFGAKFAPQMASAYAAAKGAELEPDELEGLQAQLSESTVLSAAYVQRIKGELSTVLPELRNALARRQVQGALPTVFRDWPADTDVAEWLYERQSTSAANMEQLAELLELVGDKDVDIGALQLIEEAEKLALQEFNSRATPAATALAAQMRVVAEVERRQLPELKRSVAEGVRLRQILRQWRELWRELWVEESESAHFRQIMRLADSQLEKNARQLYDSIEEEIQQEMVAEIDAGVAEPSEEADAVEESDIIEVVEQEDDTDDDNLIGETMPAGMSPGFGEMMVGLAGSADLIFRFTDGADGGAVFEFASPTLAGGSLIEFDSTRVDLAADEISAAVNDLLMQVAEIKAEQQSGMLKIPFITGRRSPVLSVYVSVESQNLRHMTIVALRQSLRSKLDALSSESNLERFDIQWREWQRSDMQQ